MNDALSPHFHLLRARVEGDVPRPGVIVVTSARPGDGASLTAFGLAECLAAVGYRTALIGTGTQDTGRRPAGVTVTTLPREGVAAARGPIEAHLSASRTGHDFTVVDAPPLGDGPLAGLLASVSDAVLLTVRLGRAAQQEDALATRVLQAVHANVLGVVPASAQCIADFAVEAKRSASPVTPARGSAEPRRGTELGLAAASVPRG